MSVNPDVLIIGGGAIGAACARALAAAGRAVLVVEPSEPTGQAWQAAGGLLAAQIEAGPADPLLQFALAGRAWYAEHHFELEAAAGMALDLDVGGIAALAPGAEDEARLRARAAWQIEHGLRCEWLAAEHVAAVWPWLRPVRGALRAPQDGMLDPVRLVDALAADGRRRGVRWADDRIQTLEVSHGRVLGARGRDRYSAGMVLVAAGAWTGRIAGLPRPISVEPVRGQMLAYRRPAELVAEVAIYGYGHYLLTRRREVIIGSTMEHAGFDPATTPEGIARLRAAAERLCPPLAGTEPTRSWAGLRPGTPDGLPIIGAEPRVEGLWYATGHGRNGILLAGITGEVIARLVAGDVLTDDVSGFRPERFWNWE